MKNLFGVKKQYVGPVNVADGSEIVSVFQPGINRLSCDGQLGIAFVDSGEVTDMFTLDPGQHRIKYPDASVVVIVECEPGTKWFVKSGGVFNPSDPTRIEASLVRPRSQREEMQAYVNELAARAYGKAMADDLRAGRAEFDTSQDDYSEEHEDDTQAPLSTHQLEFMMQEMQLEIQRRQEAERTSQVPPGDVNTPGGNEPPPGEPTPEE